MPRTSSWRAIWTLHRRHHPLAAALLPVCGGDAHSARTELQWLRERARAVVAADAARRTTHQSFPTPSTPSTPPPPPPPPPSPPPIPAFFGGIRSNPMSSSAGAGAITARIAGASPRRGVIDSQRQWRRRQQTRHLRRPQQLLRRQRQQQQQQQENLLLQRYCAMRRQGRPLQYIIGDQPFGDVDILCRPGVLIPRYLVFLLTKTKRKML